MIENLGAVPYHPRQKKAFRQSPLAERWFDQYPSLFDERDIANIRSQREHGSHFAESLAAVTLHVTTGYSVLFQKYEFDGHERKNRIFRGIVGGELADLIRDGEVQGPDLFLYAPDESDWFFCEVKGPNDRLRAGQKELFETISSAVGRPVYLLNLREWKFE